MNIHLSAKQRTQIRGFIFLAIIVAIAIIIIRSCSDDEQPQKAPKIPLKELNKTVTNEMSEIPELEEMDTKFKRYIRDWHIKGASLAIVRNDSLVYAKGYGWADEELQIPMEPGHIMRIASVSKLITAVGIMKLQEEGKLNIKDKVFGPEGILNDDFYNEMTKGDARYNEMTIEHLLRHTGGFGGWFRDPLFWSIDVQNTLRLDHPPTKKDFMKVALQYKMRAAPGEFSEYSNLGYLLLSEIIEKVSGKKYEKYINQHVLKPAGCYDAHIGGIYYKDKRKNEVRYYTHEGDGKYVPDFQHQQDSVERCYGGTNLSLLSGAGAWCCSPIELARFVASIDGDDTVKDILSKKSIKQMTEYIDEHTYSLGWNETHPEKGWNRTGTLAGTSALIHVYPDGECWILVTNTSTYRGHKFTNYTDALFSECRRLYSSKLPAQNLFE